MIFRSTRHSPGLVTSRLYSEQTFYRVFMDDLERCRHEALIESPFLTTRRVRCLLPTIRKLTSHDVRITVNTRPPQEHEGRLRDEAENCIELLQSCGVQILFTGGHHRKLAIFDRAILWEGSLNILSQNNSCEVMRRIESESLAKQMIDFTDMGQFL